LNLLLQEGHPLAYRFFNYLRVHPRLHKYTEPLLQGIYWNIHTGMLPIEAQGAIASFLQRMMIADPKSAQAIYTSLSLLAHQEQDRTYDLRITRSVLLTAFGNLKTLALLPKDLITMDDLFDIADGVEVSGFSLARHAFIIRALACCEGDQVESDFEDVESYIEQIQQARSEIDQLFDYAQKNIYRGQYIQPVNVANTIWMHLNESTDEHDLQAALQKYVRFNMLRIANWEFDLQRTLISNRERLEAGTLSQDPRKRVAVTAAYDDHNGSLNIDQGSVADLTHYYIVLYTELKKKKKLKEILEAVNLENVFLNIQLRLLS